MFEKTDDEKKAASKFSRRKVAFQKPGKRPRSQFQSLRGSPKVLAVDVAMRVPGDRLGHDEGEDTRLPGVAHPQKPVQKRHPFYMLSWFFEFEASSLFPVLTVEVACRQKE